MNAGPPSATPAETMTLLGFVTQLLQSGSVALSEELQPFSKDDLRGTADLLGKYHRWDAMSMPLVAPAYHPQAALWAAHYVCRALQFLMVRHLSEAQIAEHLQPFDGPSTAEAAYSADLCLRHLPRILSLAKSFSPTDPLVKNLLETALAWPFSAVGTEVETHFESDHPSMQIAYADRVLASKDRKLARQAVVNLQLQAALGAHGKRLWADFEPINPENQDNARTIEH